MVLFSSCDNFESEFYDRIEKGQIKAVKNGSDTFDLSTITDFEWDSVILISGNESVPVFRDEVEEILNKPNLKYMAEDLSVNRERFYFLTPKKEIITKTMNKGYKVHKQGFSLENCLIDTINERYWLSREECKFIVKTNSKKIGEGTVFLFPKCNTSLKAENIKFYDN